MTRSTARPRAPAPSGFADPPISDPNARRRPQADLPCEPAVVTRATRPHAATRRPQLSAARDALIATLCVIGGGFLFVQYDSAERISSALLRWEHLELDDLLLTAGLAVLATTWFAIRRWRDAQRELRAREHSEAEKTRYLNRLEDLSSELLASEQRERDRLAELLHDDVGQTLYACRLQLERVRARTGDPDTQRILDEARELTARAMRCTRELTVDLSPPVLHDLGLFAALEALLRSNQERFGLPAELIGGEAWERIPASWHPAVFHSVRELLANAAKHAAASAITVSAVAAADGCIHVAVCDDGCGLQAPRGFGLIAIERRMAWLGAVVQLESSPGQGTRATLQLPAAAR
jgi:signal transduction histidine kinase